MTYVYFFFVLDRKAHFAQVTIYNAASPLLPVLGFERIDTYLETQELLISKRSELSVIFGKTGLLKAVQVNGQTFPVQVEFIKYGTRINQAKSTTNLFLPDKQQSEPIIMGNDRIVHLIEGPLFSRVFIEIPYVKHICTVFNSTGSDGLGLHIDNEVDISNTEDLELAMKFNTNIESRDTFYTDLNGLDVGSESNGFL